MMPFSPPATGRGRYLKPPMPRAVPRLTMKRCGSGALPPVYLVCQKVAASPSIAAAPEFCPLAASWLSTCTAQPVRGITAPARSSRLNSAIEVQALPPCSDTASSITYCTVAPSTGVTFHASLVLLAATALRVLTVTTYWPTVVGVPVIARVVVLIARPGGSPVADQVSVPVGVVA